MDLKMVSVTVLTKDSVKYLRQVLEQLRDFGEVVVMDSGSTDETLSIAGEYSNVTIHTTVFDGFGPVHNRTTAVAKHNWILSVDSDEVLTNELIDELKRLKADVDTVYAMPRQTYYHGKLIRWCGWYPDHQWRLYHRDKTSFSDAKVHESVIVEGMKTCRLHHPMTHYSYEDTADFLAKMQTYSTLFAEQNKGRKKSSLSKALIHGIFAFVKSYFLKRGFFGGKEGFIISVYNANTAFYKYLKLAGF